MVMCRQKKIVLLLCSFVAAVPASCALLKDGLRYGGGAAALIAAGVAVYQSNRIARLQKEVFIQETKKRNTRGYDYWVAHYALQDAKKSLASARVSRAIALGFAGGGVAAVGGSFLMKNAPQKGTGECRPGGPGASQELSRFSGTGRNSQLSEVRLCVQADGATGGCGIRDADAFVCTHSIDSQFPVAFDSKVLTARECGGGGNCGFWVMQHFLHRLNGEAISDVCAVRGMIVDTLIDQLKKKGALGSAEWRWVDFLASPAESMLYAGEFAAMYAKEIERKFGRDLSNKLVSEVFSFCLSLYCDKIGLCDFDGSKYARKKRLSELSILPDAILLSAENWADSFELSLFAEHIKRPVIEFRPNTAGQYQVANISWPSNYDKEKFSFGDAALFLNLGNCHWQALELARGLMTDARGSHDERK